jgi:hypothetical protein
MSAEADQSGFDPSSIHLFHGGDFEGIEQKIDYLSRLGITSIWMTPIFRNRAVQDFGEGVPRKGGYHGYWILDFLDVDPHLGTKEGLESLIERAKAAGIGTVLDIVVNHTADVILPKDGTGAYQYKFSKPYLDARSAAFDDRDYIDKENFPNLNAEVMAALTFKSEASAASRTCLAERSDRVSPTAASEVSTGGERLCMAMSPVSTIYSPSSLRSFKDDRNLLGLDQGFCNFRISIDTVKHVNNEFWQRFIPAIQEQATSSTR